MFNALITHSPLLYFVQSIWRDEAFSILAAEKPLSYILPRLSFEPPVYYTLLHFWIRIFGESEIAARSLSLLAFGLATVIIIEWSDKLFLKSFLRWFVPLLFFLNPMLSYYAFEIRTYGWYILFATLSMYAYTEKKWRLLTAATILGFYTHTYFLFVFAAQIVHYAWYNRHLFRSWKRFRSDPMVRTGFISFLLIAPWLVRVVTEAAKLKQSWYYPVDLHLIKSLLGNMFIGYEGTPWYLWRYTAWGSLGLLLLFLFAFFKAKQHKIITYLILTVWLPLVIVIGISFFKPLFVNRYLIPVTVAMVLSVGFALSAVKRTSVQVLAAAAVLGLTLFVDVWYPSRHAKVPIRNTMREVNSIRENTDDVYATSSLVFFEVLYYSKNRTGVYLYNPTGGAFPWYVGEAVFSKNEMVSTLPVYPKRAILVNPDGSYSIAFRMLEGETVK